MPQFTAISVLCLSSVKRPSNGPASQRAASMTALTIVLCWLAPSTTRRIPAMRIAATTVPIMRRTRATVARVSRLRAVRRSRVPMRPARKVLMTSCYPVAGRLAPCHDPAVMAADDPLTRLAQELERLAQAQLALGEATAGLIAVAPPQERRMLGEAAQASRRAGRSAAEASARTLAAADGAAGPPA